MLMFDIGLKEELLSLKKSNTNINNLFYINNKMRQIIKCRTKDKIDLLNYLLNNNLIDLEKYKEYCQYIKHDFIAANNYILGWGNI